MSAQPSALNDDTVRDYLSALQRLMMTDDLPAWRPALRTRARVRVSPKRHLIDPSLAAAALGLGPTQLLADLTTAGLLFESMAVRDLRVYAEARGLQALQFRDSSGHEIDAVLLGRDGQWMAVEVRLGIGQVDAAAASLTAFAAKLAPEVVAAPHALVVVTATGPAHRRPDGIDVVPLHHLAP